MLRLGKYVLGATLALVPATALAASGAGTVPGNWHQLPSAPFAVPQSPAAVWTGKQLIVFGRRPVTNPAADAAEAYDPAKNSWTHLSPPAGPSYSPGYRAVWTGNELLAFGAFHSVAFNPSTSRWRVLHGSLPTGITVWTGSEAIGWGGGCCGDAESNGAAYNPAKNAFRKLAGSPLPPSQGPLGAWTGKELVLFVSGFDTSGKRLPARFARAAAYNPATNTWRRLAPMPGSDTRFAGVAVWDGTDVLVVASGANGKSAYAYSPTANRWRRLADLPAARNGTALWTGKKLLLWGGQSPAGTLFRDGLAYDPRANSWATLPHAPFRARTGSVAAWTGRSLLVWGGEIGTPVGTSKPPVFVRDGASFTPAAS